MRDALDDLACLHPASRLGRFAYRRFEQREGRQEAEGSGPTGLAGELAAAVAMFAVLFAVLAAIADLTIDPPDIGQQAAAAIASPAETR